MLCLHPQLLQISYKLQVTSYVNDATEIKEELAFLATRTTFSTTKTAATEDRDNEKYYQCNSDAD